MKSIVSIRACDTYEMGMVEKAVTEAATAAGITDLIRQDSRVLLKINLLNTAPPERAVTTHPEVVRAMIQLVKKLGGKPVVGDAPGIDIPGRGRKALRTSGNLAVCQQEDVEGIVFTDRGYEKITVDGNVHMTSLHIARELLEADIVIGMAKAKSHMQAYYSGAIKNFFGCIPQNDRKLAHSLPSMLDFSMSLVDILAACKPSFALTDAIVGMEGRGPSDGKPKKLGLILASKDLVALDRVTTSCMGFDTLDVPHIRFAAQRGFGEGDLANIEINGPPIDSVRKNFDPPPTSAMKVPGFINASVMKLWRVEPKINPGCVLCGHCASICPVDAITLGPTTAILNYDKCIGCFCCHELCPYSVIRERTSLLVKLFRLFGRVQGMIKGGDPA